MTALHRFHGTEADSDAAPLTEPAPTSTMPDYSTGDTLSPVAWQPMQTIDWPTTKRFARSMFADSAAFPQDAEYATPVEPFEHALDWLDRWRVWGSLAAVACGVALVCAWLIGGAK